jgi:hypothetical protein
MKKRAPKLGDRVRYFFSKYQTDTGTITGFTVKSDNHYRTSMLGIESILEVLPKKESDE